jgi:hypothetical protein
MGLLSEYQWLTCARTCWCTNTFRNSQPWWWGIHPQAYKKRGDGHQFPIPDLEGCSTSEGDIDIGYSIAQLKKRTWAEKQLKQWSGRDVGNEVAVHYTHPFGTWTYVHTLLLNICLLLHIFTFAKEGIKVKHEVLFNTCKAVLNSPNR